jgi:histidinol-phosphate aminotransferase
MVMFKQNLDSITPYVPGQSIESIQQEYGLSNVIKLASNENPLGPAVPYKDCQCNIAQYPDYNAHPLSQAIADTWETQKDHIILGNGSDELLLLVGLACLETGDEVISSDCTFSEYEFVTKVTGATYVACPMENNTYNPQAIINAITPNTKVIFIANPNNPTGTYLNHTDITAILNATNPTQTLVVLDEAYAEYTTAQDYPNTQELLSTYPNLFVTRTFSKIYGLAALRLGYGIGHPNIIQALQKIRPPFNVNGIALACGLKALNQTEFVTQSKQLNIDGMAYIQNALSNTPCTILPSQGNFLFIEFNNHSGTDIANKLLETGIIVRNMKSFGRDNAIRVTIGTQTQNELFTKELISCLN